VVSAAVLSLAGGAFVHWRFRRRKRNGSFRLLLCSRSRWRLTRTFSRRLSTMPGWRTWVTGSR